VFDDFFYLLQIRTSNIPAPAPGTSLLVLTGCLLSILGWRQFKQEPFFWVNGAAIILWGGVIFGGVPAAVLTPIPLLNRIGHIHTDFSYLLVIHLTIQAAYGFISMASGKNFRRMAVDFVWVGLIFAGIMMVYCLTTSHRDIRWNYFLCAGAGAFGAPLLFAYLNNRHRGITLMGWAGVMLLGFGAIFRFGLYCSGNEDLLMISGSREVLNAPSPGITKIKTAQTDPFRVVGLNFNLYGDYAAVYDLEDIRSCAPLSNAELINLLKSFPGFQSCNLWAIDPANPAQAQPLLNLLNVKYLLGPPEVSYQVGTGFRLMESSDFQIFINREAWPRAFFTDKVVSINSNDEFIQYLSANGDHPFVALTKGEIAKQPEVLNLEGKSPTVVQAATSYRLRPNSTAFDIHASSAGMVCLTEGQAKDFIATANNETKPVLTVNRAFKGIYLDRPGDYHIQFTYRPRYWRLACFCFWSSVCLVIAVVVAGGIHARRRKNQAQFLTSDHE
jgi:hypothetical protein